VHLSIASFGCKTKVAFVPIAPPVRGAVGQTANGWFARYFKVVFSIAGQAAIVFLLKGLF
jgi:hypothetical protein